jgi:hypothetical protein
MSRPAFAFASSFQRGGSGSENSHINASNVRSDSSLLAKETVGWTRLVEDQGRWDGLLHVISTHVSGQRGEH